MTYVDKVWVDGSGGGTPLDADGLNDWEARITAMDASTQPLDSDLTAIAALSTTSFGRSLLALADAAAARTAIGVPVVPATYPASGNFFTSSHIFTNGTAGTESLLTLYPVSIGLARTLTQLASRVNTAGGVASTVRNGLYSNLAGDLYPDALLFDSGDISTATTGQKEAVCSVALSAQTVYWWGAVVRGNGGTVPLMTKALGTNAAPSLGDAQANSGSILSGTGAYNIGYTQASVTGALPSTFTSTRTVTQVPIMVAGKAA